MVGFFFFFKRLPPGEHLAEGTGAGGLREWLAGWLAEDRKWLFKLLYVLHAQQQSEQLGQFGLVKQSPTLC